MSALVPLLVTLPLVGAAIVVPTSRDAHAPKLDIGGALLSMAGLGTLLWAIIEAPAHGWTSGQTLLSFAIATGLLGVFMTWESLLLKLIKS